MQWHHYLFIITIIQTLVMGIDVQAMPAFYVSVFYLEGFNIALGLIGEYRKNIYGDAKNRPLYFVDEYSNSKVMEGI